MQNLENGLDRETVKECLKVNEFLTNLLIKAITEDKMDLEFYAVRSHKDEEDFATGDYVKFIGKDFYNFGEKYLGWDY